jgi:hypothetical protein
MQWDQQMSDWNCEIQWGNVSFRAQQSNKKAAKKEGPTTETGAFMRGCLGD